LIPETAN